MTLQDNHHKRHNNNFDLLRLVAALLVFVSHSFVISGHHEPHLLTDSHNFGIPLGAFGVTVFFAISGYLITESWERSRQSGKFMRNRVLRLYPALCLNFLIVALLIAPVAATIPLSDYYVRVFSNIHKLIAGIITFNMPELPGVFNSNPVVGKVNVPLWTLVFEAACYLTICMLGMIFSLKKAIPILLLVYIIALYQQITAPSHGGDLGIVYVLAFITGSGLYLYWQNIRFKKHLAAFALIAFIAVLAANFYNLVIYTLLASYLTVYIGTSKRLVNAAKYGDFSYGLYIYAWPVQQCFVAAFAFSFLTNMFLSLAVTFLFAAISWHLVEKRALRLKA